MLTGKMAGHEASSAIKLTLSSIVGFIGFDGSPYIVNIVS